MFALQVLISALEVMHTAASSVQLAKDVFQDVILENVIIRE